MRGKRPVNWIFDWLGLGSLGQDYTVLPAVQPIVSIDAFEYPRKIETYNAIDNLIAGTVVRVLPNNADKKLLRIWLDFWYLRGAVAGTDVTALYRDQPDLTDYPVVYSHGTVSGAGDYVPMIGGMYMAVGGGLPYSIKGLPPLALTEREVLRVAATAVGAVGTISYWGHFVDVDRSAPLPPNFLT